MNKNEFNTILNSVVNENEVKSSTIIGFKDFNIKLKSNSEKLINEIDKYFFEFLFISNNKSKNKPIIEIIAYQKENYEINTNEFIVKKPDLEKRKIKEEYINIDAKTRIIKKRLTGMHFFISEKLNIAIGPCLLNINQIVNFINNRYIQYYLFNEHLLCHASGVANNNESIIIAGFSGMGKSTLALHIINNNLKFLSNDRVLIKKSDSGVDSIGVPKLPRINPGTIVNNKMLCKMLTEEEQARYNLMNNTELWELEDKYDVFINEIYGSNRIELNSKIKAVILLNWFRDKDKCSII